MTVEIPKDIREAADARALARAGRDWPEADRLRAVIEAAGWKVVDQGMSYTLSPAAPPDVADGSRVRYGSSANVPSRLEEPATGLATVVLVATDWPEDVNRTVDALQRTSPEGTSIVVVADGPSEAQSEALDSLDGPAGPEVVWTSERLGQAAALDAGFRRASGPVVIVLDTSVEPTGDIVTPLVRALDDPAVAVTGGWGIVSADMRTFTDAPAG